MEPTGKITLTFEDVLLIWQTLIQVFPQFWSGTEMVIEPTEHPAGRIRREEDGSVICRWNYLNNAPQVMWNATEEFILHYFERVE